MDAATLRRIGKVFKEVNELKKTRVGDFTVAELLASAPDAEAKKRVIKIVCGTPPYSRVSCGILLWEVEKGRKTKGEVPETIEEILEASERRSE